jgi:hypothetical protein
MEPMHRFLASRQQTIPIVPFLILISLLLAACTPPPAVALLATDTPEAVVDTQTPQPLDTATPEPELDRIVFVSNQVQPQIENLLQDLAEQNGMVLEVLSEIQPQDIQSTWKVVVMLPAPENINEWTSAAAGTQFVVSSDADLPSAPNLSVIHSRPEHLAFAAGYIGAVITPDWRIAGLLPADTALADDLMDAFQNGGYYYCGLCRTMFAPFVRWPLVSSLPVNSDDTAWQASVTEIEPSVVYGIYVDPRVGSTQLLSWLSEKNIVMLGGETPPADVLPRWAVTIRPEFQTSLSEIIPSVLTGSGGQLVNAGLELVDINPRLLSPGRQRLIETMLADLNAGYIYPFTPSE